MDLSVQGSRLPALAAGSPVEVGFIEQRLVERQALVGRRTDRDLAGDRRRPS